MAQIKIQRKYFDLIKSGKKKFEIRKWCRPEIVDTWVELTLTDTNKVEGVIKIGAMEDLNMLTEEDKDFVLDLALVDEDFRFTYPCNYAYAIMEFSNVH